MGKSGFLLILIPIGSATMIGVFSSNENLTILFGVYGSVLYI